MLLDTHNFEVIKRTLLVCGQKRQVPLSLLGIYGEHCMSVVRSP